MSAYQNGIHAGFVLYMTDSAQCKNFVDDLRDATQNSIGAGNFLNLSMYAPNWKKDGIQLLQIPNVAAKDEIGRLRTFSVWFLAFHGGEIFESLALEQLLADQGSAGGLRGAVGWTWLWLVRIKAFFKLCE